MKGTFHTLNTFDAQSVFLTSNCKPPSECSCGAIALLTRNAVRAVITGVTKGFEIFFFKKSVGSLHMWSNRGCSEGIVKSNSRFTITTYHHGFHMILTVGNLLPVGNWSSPDHHALGGAHCWARGGGLFGLTQWWVLTTKRNRTFPVASCEQLLFDVFIYIYLGQWPKTSKNHTIFGSNGLQHTMCKLKFASSKSNLSMVQLRAPSWPPVRLNWSIQVAMNSKEPWLNRNTICRWRMGQPESSESFSTTILGRNMTNHVKKWCNYKLSTRNCRLHKNWHVPWFFMICANPHLFCLATMDLLASLDGRLQNARRTHCIWSGIRKCTTFSATDLLIKDPLLVFRIFCMVNLSNLWLTFMIALYSIHFCLIHFCSWSDVGFER